mmetsp:Transcript_14599/g.25814  ORF Transcript_14599/g.25814 Transcript_14599/m.25814 type:complete len:84 (-) Transcript_14599:924-1175(-)
MCPAPPELAGQASVLVQRRVASAGEPQQAAQTSKSIKGPSGAPVAVSMMAHVEREAGAVRLLDIVKSIEISAASPTSKGPSSM